MIIWYGMSERKRVYGEKNTSSFELFVVNDTPRNYVVLLIIYLWQLNH